jgi:hypothetical protein
MEQYRAYLSAHFSAELEPGEQTIQCTMNLRYHEPVQYRYTPVITWDADSFMEWELPDPTLGGLLPGMTTERLKQIFGIEEDDWEKTNVLDLWDW